MKSKVLVEIIVDHPEHQYEGNTRKIIEKHLKRSLSVGHTDDLSSVNYNDLEVKMVVHNSEILKKRDPWEGVEDGTEEAQE